METFSIFDGLVLTIVAMLVVFVVLAAIWGLVELNAKVIAYFRKDEVKPVQSVTQPTRSTSTQLTANPKHKKVAEIMALILASEDKPDKKFEIIETKRVK